jgi:hypothetical protein
LFIVYLKKMTKFMEGNSWLKLIKTPALVIIEDEKFLFKITVVW